MEGGQSRKGRMKARLDWWSSGGEGN